MHVTIAGLRQQAWRSDDLYARLRKYAGEIGCRVEGDSIWADELQAKALAFWWMMHVDGQFLTRRR